MKHVLSSGVLLAILVSPLLGAGDIRFWDSEGNPLPYQTDDEILRLLSTAAVVDWEQLSEGINRSSRVVLEENGYRFYAIFRDVSLREQGQSRQGRSAPILRDDCIFEVAAYELNRMLGLGRVPPTVQRTLRGRFGTLQLWISGAVAEKERRHQSGLDLPQAQLEAQWQILHLFDNLIYNDDRNRGNVLYDRSGQMWMIDHTRAFRTIAELPYPGSIETCPRTLWAALHSLTRDSLQRRMNGLLDQAEVDALIARHRLLLEHIQERIDEEGEEAILLH